MNNRVITSNERSVHIYRDGVELSSGDAYIPTETLTVSISEAKDQYVYEITNGHFERGGCNGLRIADRPKVLWHLPDIGTGKVEITVGT